LHVGAAANILNQLGVTREKVREAGTRLFEPALIAGPDGQERRVVGDGEAEIAVTQARRLAARRGQSQFRSEHLLFCMATDPGSSARRVLRGGGAPGLRRTANVFVTANIFGKCSVDQFGPATAR
jgi:hypothetical protein